MRITNSMMARTVLNNMNGNLGRLNEYFMQMSSQRKIVVTSDDPVGAVKSMQMRSRLARLEQNQRNLTDTSSWLMQSEGGMSDLNELIKTAYADLINISTDAKTQADREKLAEKILQIRDQVVTLGNMTLGDRYIYGGYNTTKPPFEVDASGKLLYNGLNIYDFDFEGANPFDPVLEAAEFAQWDTDKLTYDQLKSDNIIFDVGVDMDNEISVNGIQFMGCGNNNAYKQLDDMYKLLMNEWPADWPGSPTGDVGVEDLTTQISRLQQKQEETLANAADIGGRTIRVELITNRYEVDALNYDAIRSQIEDVDLGEAIMYYKMAQAVYEASMSAGAKIIQPSLLDFLR